MTTVHANPGGAPRLQRALPDRRRARSSCTGIAGTRVAGRNGCARRAAYAALYANVDVITAYPIRPYTAIMMNLAQFVAGRHPWDAEYIHADGEALAVLRGVRARGLVRRPGPTPARPGVGVTYGYEMYSIISGGRGIPIQDGDRRPGPWTRPADFGSEHTDALCTRGHGLAEWGWAATPPQEVFDKSLLAYAIGEDPRVLLPQDGGAGRLLRVAHRGARWKMPAAEQVGRVPAPVPAAVSPLGTRRRPVSHGPQIHPRAGARPLQLERARGDGGTRYR